MSGVKGDLLALKADGATLRGDTTVLKIDLAVMKGMMGFVLAFEVLIFGKTFVH